MKALIAFLLFLLSSYSALALTCRFENTGQGRACVCRERFSVFIADDSYCSSSCRCPSISRVLNDFINSAKNTDLFLFLSSFRLNVSDNPPPPIEVNLPPFIHTTIDIANHPLMRLLLMSLKTAWIIFATILSYFIIFRR